jgi:NAD+ synthase
MIDLSIDTSTVKALLTRFLRDTISAAGYSRAVINLSGGLDSSVACYLSVEALGAQNVLALRLPYRTSSPDSLEHAQMVINTLGMPYLTIPITEMVDALLGRFPEMDSIRRGNIMARMRMIVLYDQSQAFHALPVGTGNKTETLLGYTTLYGDSACALNPLGDLYKTQVRQLACDLGVPAAIIAKPPSADLWEGQTDEGELGFTYAEVDQLLYMLVDRGFTIKACVEAGFAEDFVRSVIERMEKFQFKRTLPPVANLT